MSNISMSSMFCSDTHFYRFTEHVPSAKTMKVAMPNEHKDAFFEQRSFGAWLPQWKTHEVNANKNEMITDKK